MESKKDQNYYIDKLYKYADRFQELYSQKQYSQAKSLYDTALRVSSFLEVSGEVKEKLFGYREESYLDEEELEGMFPADMVRRCYEICTVKLYQGYEHESYRRYGQPPQYYPQPRYPAPNLPHPDPSGAEIAEQLLQKGGG